MVKRTSLGLLLATITFGLSAAHASEQCYVKNENFETVPVACVTQTLIDFNEDPVIEDNSMSFSDWNIKLQANYTDSVGDGSVTVVGNNGGYNYQGVMGYEPNLFIRGERITVWFANLSAEPQTFYPTFSFDDLGRNLYTGTEEDGFWLRSDEPITLQAGGSHPYIMNINQDFVSTLVNTNVMENADGQAVIAVDRIEYTRVADEDRPVSLCAMVRDGSTWFDSSNCDEFTVWDAKHTQAATKRTMQLAPFDTLFSTKYRMVSANGGGLTTLKALTKNVSVEDAIFVKGYAGYAGITSSVGETRKFYAGEVLAVTVKGMDLLAQDRDITVRVSFDDTDSRPYGYAGTWYSMGTQTVTVDWNGRERTYYYTFTRDTEGDHGLINVAIDENHDGEVSIEQVKLFAKQL